MRYAVREVVRKVIPEKWRKKLGELIDDYYILTFPLLSVMYKVLIIPLPNGKILLYTPKLKILGIKGCWWIYDEIVNHRVYERGYISIKKGDVVIDVGANIGIFSLYAAKKIGSNGLVIAIEPEPNTYRMLSMNTRNYPNIITYNKAIGDRERTLKLYLSLTNPGEHSLKNIENEDNYVFVEVIPLDRLVKELKLSKLNFIKIDTEGYELEVLRGAKKTLTTFYPSIALEYHSPKDRDNIIRYLKEIRYNKIIFFNFSDIARTLKEDNESESLGFIYAWREN